MKFRTCLLRIYFSTTCFLNLTWSVPIDYCLYTLNGTDCHEKPTPVFYYYKPGSRCEIAIWRGCPTYNKFDNEFQCSHHCVGKLGTVKPDIGNHYDDQANCQEILNTGNCGKEKSIYTYNSSQNACVKAIWEGCDTKNKFTDETTCKRTCVTNNDALVEWKNDIEKLSMVQMNQISNILNNVIEETELEKPIILKLESTIDQHIVEVTTDDGANGIDALDKTEKSEIVEETLTTPTDVVDTTVMSETTTETNIETTAETTTATTIETTTEINTANPKIEVIDTTIIPAPIILTTASTRRPRIYEEIRKPQETTTKPPPLTQTPMPVKIIQ